VPRFVAAAVADGLLALAVAPAGAVGDYLAVLPGDEVADDLAQRVELAGGGVHQAGGDVVPEPEVAAFRVGVALALVLPVLLGGRLLHLLV
jgi:hypothetical protein